MNVSLIMEVAHNIATTLMEDMYVRVLLVITRMLTTEHVLVSNEKW